MTATLAKTLVWIALLAACLFGPAGTLDWPWGWAVISAYAGVVVAAFLLVDHDLLRERARPGPDFERLDAVLATLGGLLLYPVTLIVAGLDHAGGWSPPLPTLLHGVALQVFAIGYALALWAMRVNRFFSTIVRIQTDRGHHLIDHGPYAWIRHPGYTGTLLAHLAMPVALGSLWALAPAGAACLLFVLRTANEDATLVRKLTGYEEYRRRVRWRLVPGVW